MTATLYHPTKPARILPAEELRRMACGPTPAHLCYMSLVAMALECKEAELLYSDRGRAVYGIADAADYGLRANPEAPAAAMLDCGELCGPILIVTAE